MRGGGVGGGGYRCLQHVVLMPWEKQPLPHGTSKMLRIFPNRASPPMQNNPNQTKSEQIKIYSGLIRRLHSQVALRGNGKAPTLLPDRKRENHEFIFWGVV